MAKPGSTEQCSPVDPNYEPSTAESKESYVGATSPMSHPLTMSTVDPNYSPSGGDSGGPKPRTRSSKEETDDMAGVEGGGGKYTDSDNDQM